MPIIRNRRRFMAALAAGATGLVMAPGPALAEPPPETDDSPPSSMQTAQRSSLETICAV
jgi:hypothetical protein